jgi:hypothetical protein
MFKLFASIDTALQNRNIDQCAAPRMRRVLASAAVS